MSEFSFIWISKLQSKMDAAIFVIKYVDIPGTVMKCRKRADHLVDKGGKLHWENREPLCVHSVGNEVGEHSWWYLSFLRALSTRRVYLSASDTCLHEPPYLLTRYYSILVLKQETLRTGELRGYGIPQPETKMISPFIYIFSIILLLFHGPAHWKCIIFVLIRDSIWNATPLKTVISGIFDKQMLHFMRLWTLLIL